MKARYQPTRTDDLSIIQQDVTAFASQMGRLTSSRNLGRFEIGTAETRIPHGATVGVPNWQAIGVRADNGTACFVSETRAGDTSFLYLIANTPCTAEIEVL